MKKYFILNKGFTLVETLIAVAILMVAIAGPLTIANQALTAALGSRNAMIATYLAQDGMESIKNIKDNELTNATFSWGNVISIACTLSNPCPTPTAWSIDLPVPDFTHGTIYNCTPVKFLECRLYTDDTKNSYFYNGTTANHLTPFTRYYYFADINSNEKVVTVVVSWNDGSVPNAITLQELMTNVSR